MVNTYSAHCDAGVREPRLVRVQQAPVEAVIALSVLFLAGELARHRQRDVGLMQRHPGNVAFTFGMLHGFGFAGALPRLDSQKGDVPLALLTFDIGVEIGQLLFVGVVLLVTAGLRRVRWSIAAWARAAPAYGIGTVAAFWTLQRMALLFRVQMKSSARH